MSVTFKVVVPVVILLVLAISGQSLYTSIRSVDDLRDSLEQQVGWISSYAGVYYTRLIDSSLATTQVLHGLAQTYMERGAPREELFGAIRSPLYDQESIVGAWIAFEPNAYDGLDAEFAGVAPFNQDGNFASYWYRAGGEVGSMGLDQYRGEPFYSVPLSNGRPYLSEPYEYEAGEEVLAMITVSMPVRSGGRTVGVVGVDIDLSASQSRIETIQPLGTGYAFIVTGSGAVAAHPNRAILMTQAAQYFQNPGDFSHAVEAHEEYRETKVAVGGQQEESLFVVSPFDMPALGETWFVGVSVPTTVMREAERKSAIAAVTGAATAIVVALLVLIPVLARITRPIRESAAAIQSISEGAGDLTQRMKVTTRDEVGRLAGSFNRFIDYQNTFIGSLKQNADRTGDAKNEVVSSAEETSASVRQIGANVQSIARQVETLDTTVTGSAAALEQTNASIQSIDGQIADQASMVEETSSAINEITASLGSTARIAQQRVTAAQELNRTVEEGQERLEEAERAVLSVVDRLSSIDQMNAVINDIAAQTNLRSMNAANEAAHAGDSGRGFAVVADEIRKLATKASDSSKEINDAVRQISESINLSSSTMKDSATSFVRIFEEAHSTTNALTEIGASVEEMSAGSVQIMKATNLLSDAVAKVREGIREVAASSEQLVAANGEIQNISSSTKLGISEINVGVQEIVRAAENLVGAAGNLDEVVSELHDQVDQFKTE